MKPSIRSIVHVSAIALLAAGLPASAYAKTSHTKKAAPKHSDTLNATLSAQQQQIAELRAQLNAMQSRLDSQASAQQDVAAKADAAQQQAAAATQQAQAVQTQVATATQTAEKASKDSGALAKAVEWAKDTKVSGRMYYNISAINQKAAGVTNEKDGGFAIKRFYVSVDHKFSDIFSGDITVDIDNVANSAGSNVGKGLYVKKAYLKAALNPAFNVVLGATDMPWIPYAEGIYGYRHVEKTLTDLDGFGTSSDWGVHVMGDLAGGLISYQVSAIDGGGYRNPTFTKTVDLEGRISLKYKGFNAAIGGYTGKLAADTGVAPVTYHTANRFNALIAYKDKVSGIPVTIGGEYFYAKNWKQVAKVPEELSDGYSIFASVSPMPKWSVFGRYDWVKPGKDLAPTQKNQYFNVGVQYSPAKIVDLALVYKRYDADNGLKIGDLSVGGTPNATRDEFGLFGQFRF